MSDSRKGQEFDFLIFHIYKTMSEIHVYVKYYHWVMESVKLSRNVSVVWPVTGTDNGMHSSCMTMEIGYPVEVIGCLW